MTYTMKEVLEFVKENDVKFVRLAFCDIFGVQKNISIMSDELERAFENGISFDASTISGFLNVEKSDLFLYPDPGTLSVLPWRPQQGRVVRFFCDIKYADKRHFEGDTRNILKEAIKRCMDFGYACKIGPECEFYLFYTDEEGNPIKIPFDKGSYLDIAPLDKCENIRREICLTLEELGIKPQSSHHEQGPGQNEVVFKYDDALTAADNFITFKSVIKVIAANNGLFASFMPKPIIDDSGSGFHINISLSKNGQNIFDKNCNEYNKHAQSFTAGILDKIMDITAFANPLTNSYARFGSFEAPKYISWSHENRSQLIRIPAEYGDYSRIELRSPDPSCNPYLTFALVLNAGLDGIECNLKLPKAVDLDLYKADPEKLKSIKTLPENLKQALDILSGSDFVKRVVPEKVLNRYLKLKNDEWLQYTESPKKDNMDSLL